MKRFKKSVALVLSVVMLIVSTSFVAGIEAQVDNHYYCHHFAGEHYCNHDYDYDFCYADVDKRVVHVIATRDFYIEDAYCLDHFWYFIEASISYERYNYLTAAGRYEEAEQARFRMEMFHGLVEELFHEHDEPNVSRNIVMPKPGWSYTIEADTNVIATREFYAELYCEHSGLSLGENVIAAHSGCSHANMTLNVRLFYQAHPASARYCPRDEFIYFYVCVTTPGCTFRSQSRVISGYMHTGASEGCRVVCSNCSWVITGLNCLPITISGTCRQECLRCGSVLGSIPCNWVGGCEQQCTRCGNWRTISCNWVLHGNGMVCSRCGRLGPLINFSPDDDEYKIHEEKDLEIVSQ